MTEKQYYTYFPNDYFALIKVDGMGWYLVLLYALIRSIANSTGYCIVTIKRLADIMFMDESSIEHGLKELVKLGMIEIETGKVGDRNVNMIYPQIEYVDRIIQYYKERR